MIKPPFPNMLQASVTYDESPAPAPAQGPFNPNAHLSTAAATSLAQDIARSALLLSERAESRAVETNNASNISALVTLAKAAVTAADKNMAVNSVAEVDSGDMVLAKPLSARAVVQETYMLPMMSGALPVPAPNLSQIAAMTKTPAENRKRNPLPSGRPSLTEAPVQKQKRASLPSGRTFAPKVPAEPKKRTSLPSGRLPSPVAPVQEQKRAAPPSNHVPSPKTQYKRKRWARTRNLPPIAPKPLGALRDGCAGSVSSRTLLISVDLASVSLELQNYVRPDAINLTIPPVRGYVRPDAVVLTTPPLHGHVRPGAFVSTTAPLQGHVRQDAVVSTTPPLSLGDKRSSDEIEDAEEPPAQRKKSEGQHGPPQIPVAGVSPDVRSSAAIKEAEEPQAQQQTSEPQQTLPELIYPGVSDDPEVNCAAGILMHMSRSKDTGSGNDTTIVKPLPLKSPDLHRPSTTPNQRRSLVLGLQGDAEKLPDVVPPAEVQYDSAGTIDEPLPSPPSAAQQQPLATTHRKRPGTAKRRAPKNVTKVEPDVGAQEAEEEEEKAAVRKQSLRAGLRTRRAPSAKAKESAAGATAEVKRKASAFGGSDSKEREITIAIAIAIQPQPAQ